jgi:hypothetical protein
MNRTHQRVFNSVVGFVACMVILFSGWIDSDPDTIVMCRLFIILFTIAIIFTVRDLLREIRANKALFKEAPNES